jgi:hypothetical protein
MLSIKKEKIFPLVDDVLNVFNIFVFSTYIIMVKVRS